MKNIRPYLAGILDGEGYVGLLQHKKTRKDGVKYISYTPRMIISFLGKERNRKVLELFKERYGGCIYDKKIYEYNQGYVRKSHSPMIVYEVRFVGAMKIMKDLYKYLIIKKPQVDLLLQFKKQKNTKIKLTEKEIMERERIANGIKLLNGNKPNSI